MGKGIVWRGRGWLWRTCAVVFILLVPVPIILLLVFGLGLHWFPIISGTSPAGIVLPALTLAIPLAGFMSQSVRTEFERSLEQPFVLSARMRGMGEWGIRLRHVLRHAVIPAVTLSGWALGATLSGAVMRNS